MTIARVSANAHNAATAAVKKKTIMTPPSPSYLSLDQLAAVCRFARSSGCNLDSFAKENTVSGEFDELSKLPDARRTKGRATSLGQAD